MAGMLGEISSKVGRLDSGAWVGSQFQMHQKIIIRKVTVEQRSEEECGCGGCIEIFMEEGITLFSCMERRVTQEMYKDGWVL